MKSLRHQVLNRINKFHPVTLCYYAWLERNCSVHTHLFTHTQLFIEGREMTSRFTPIDFGAQVEVQPFRVRPHCVTDSGSWLGRPSWRDFESILMFFWFSVEILHRLSYKMKWMQKKLSLSHQDILFHSTVKNLSCQFLSKLMQSILLVLFDN